jgi:hypothetical protein
MKPISVAGAAAFLEYVRKDFQIGEADWHYDALRIVASALKQMGSAK